MYEELKDKNFELIAVAQDTAGEAAAGSFYDAAQSTFTTLIDVRHDVSSLYGMVNVPTAVWVDEQGKIVRQNEGAYSRQFRLGTMTIGTDEFTPALRDWIENGEESIYAQKPEQVAAKIRKPNHLATSIRQLEIGRHSRLQQRRSRHRHGTEAPHAPLALDDAGLI